VPNKVIGIDLGTTYSVVAYVDDEGNPRVIANEHGERTTPSVVLIGEDGTIEVGKTALRRVIADSERVCRWVKRRIGDNDFRFQGLSAVQISAEIIKYLKRVAEAELGPVDEAVITCPAYFSAQEVENTRKAGELAGLKVREIIKEPTAAAVRYGLEKLHEGDRFVVCDLGGGTYDACVMKMENGLPSPIATAGSRILGGHDWTEILVDMVCDKLAPQLGDEDPRGDESVAQYLYQACENAKRDFSSSESIEVACQVDGKLATAKIARSDFEDDTESKMDVVLNETHNAIVHKAGLTWEQIGQLILVGGSSRLRRLPLALSDKYKQETGKEIRPVVSEEPDLIVALGAAILGHGEVRVRRSGLQVAAGKTAPKSGLVSVKDFKRICERDLGTKVFAKTNAGLVIENSSIIPQGTPLNPPPKESREYQVVRDGQDAIEVPVVEFDAVGSEEIFCTYRFGCPASIRKGTKIKVTFEYTLNGEIVVTARDLAAGADLQGDRTAYQEPEPPGGNPCCVVFLIDCSYSMDENHKISLARQSIIENATTLLEKNPGTVVGVVGFADSSRVVTPLTSDAGEVERTVSRLTTSGFTALCSGLRQSLEQIRSAGNELDKAIVLVTDGMPTDSGEDAVRIASQDIRGAGIELFTVGLGEHDVDEAFLKRLTPNQFVVSDFSKMGQCMGNFLAQLTGESTPGKTGLIKWS